MFKKYSSKFMAILLTLAMVINLMLAMTITVSAASTETCNFANLGTAADGNGYVRVGSYFRVQQSKNFQQSIGVVSGSDTAIYPWDAQAQNSSDPTPYSVTIKAEGGSDCKTFTFNDLGLSAYNVGGPYCFTAFSITFYNLSGNLITTENLGSSAIAVSQVSVINLSQIYTHGTWNVSGVASLKIDFILSGSGGTGAGNLQFENITVTDVSSTTAASTVTTQGVTGINSTTATGNGNITSLGSPNPTAYGVCWNTTGTPTTLDSKVDKGDASATGAFTASMTSLTANTTYHVRAYATNTAGTSYGDEVDFTTSPASTAPWGGSISNRNG